MRELNMKQIESVEGGLLAHDVGYFIGGAIADGVDAVQNVLNPYWWMAQGFNNAYGV
jgi:hypothetical protein